MTESKFKDGTRRLLAFRQEHPMAEVAACFAAGFLFDVVTLSRIDDLFTLVQQAVYLMLLAGLMILEERYRAGVAAPPAWLRKAWRFSEDAIHFLFGSLLSVFTLFYLKSSSGISSILFMAALCGLLVANELPYFRERGPIVRFALLSLCLTSYLALLLPVVFGFLSKWLFVTAVVLSCAALGWLVHRLRRWTRGATSIVKHVAAPAFGMQALLVLAYFFGAIPPVPLSVKFIGIYHEVIPPGRGSAPEPESAPAPVPEVVPGPEPVPEFAPSPEIAPTPESAPEPEAPTLASVIGNPAPAPSPVSRPRTEHTYQLKHLRPWWKLWHHGDQDFAARPGDVVHCFARVFAPNGFRDAIYVHWWLESAKGGWVDQGRAQVSISGGRGDGFRVIATKKNYKPGRWRAEIETDDGRDIGVIHFDLIEDSSTGARDFRSDHL